jgi:pSer/pThr/pTyr-binding forkhead associated (FHA) protein
MNNVQPILKMSSPEGNYKENVLQYGINLIGRSPDQSLVDKYNLIALETDDNKISRNHFYIEWGQNSRGEHFILIYDIGSSNGTFIQGFGDSQLEEEDKVYLVHNDHILIGDTSLYVHIPIQLHMIKALITERKEDSVKTITWGSPKL